MPARELDVRSVEKSLLLLGLLGLLGLPFILEGSDKQQTPASEPPLPVVKEDGTRSETVAPRRLGPTHDEPGCSTNDNDEALESFRLLLLLSLLFVSLLIAFTLRRFKSEYLHESTASILMGFAVGLCIQLLSDQEQFETVVTFDQQLFFIYLLPPIIFESGYNFNKGVFFSNIVSIFSFAILGTIISAFVFGFGVWGIGLLNVYKYDLTLGECMVFGALISATDPVTVIAIFKELKVDSNLFANVFGESVLDRKSVV